MDGIKNKLRKHCFGNISSAPLAFFRIAFGFVLFISMIRFMLKGWVAVLYVQPSYYFPFYGFEWVKPLGATEMYLIFIVLAVSALFIGFGFLYRISSSVFFILFTYVELIDKSNYLNHYYFISIISFLLCLVPAGRAYSLDVKFGWVKACTHVPAWCISIFKFQLAIVYFYAGIAKVNSDWLLHAMPLRIWLPSKYDVPLIGYFLDERWVAYLFSWAGMVYDISIPFLLMWRRTIYVGIFLVVVFHVLTFILFPMIGMFPFIMLMAALIFLPESFHTRVLTKITQSPAVFREALTVCFEPKKVVKTVVYVVLSAHFLIQIILPLRFIFYPGVLFWTEEGYRFSWRVMLMEKAGYATFVVKDAKTGKSEAVDNSVYLTKQQEKMMATQPDMILYYAKILEADYKKKKMEMPQVFVESYVTLNGRASRLFIDPSVDLVREVENFKHKDWIIPFEK